MRRRRDPEVDVGMRLRESADAMHQPLGSEVRRGADRQRARALALDEPLGPNRDPIERVADDREILARRLSDLEPLMLAVEQLDAELLLERLHLVAYRALRDGKFLGGTREAFVPRGGLERPERSSTGMRRNMARPP